MTAMAAAATRGGVLWERLYGVLMRRNSVYVTFVVAGAFAGERKKFEDIPVLGQGQVE